VEAHFRLTIDFKYTERDVGITGACIDARLGDIGAVIQETLESCEVKTLK
jgi:hypothetical protein